jgi:SAM-dependent methyltransferase
LSSIRPHSRAMQLFLALGFKRIAWALRRLHCPVDKTALVLEVGSGGNPYARANVLLDAYEETRERHWAPLISDRPTVLGFVENLPFKNKAFDFVIAAHVLEHSADPAVFLAELQRVAKAGYIEVPDAFMERVNPYRDHRLEIACTDGQLVINKKTRWDVDPGLVALYEARAKTLIAGSLIPKNPFDFHVRYYWNENIGFSIVNPEADATWLASEVTHRHASSAQPTGRERLVGFLRRVFSQRHRNRHLDIFSLLRCPTCFGHELFQEGNHMKCRSCSAMYSVKGGIPVLNSHKEEK